MTDDEIKRVLGQVGMGTVGAGPLQLEDTGEPLTAENVQALCADALNAREELRVCAAVAGHHANELRILLEEARAERDQAQKDAVLALGGFRVMADRLAQSLFDHDTKVRIDGYAARHPGYKPAPVGDGK